jgi:hypothetical protein
MELKIGDIVEHSLLKKKKVIVGIDGDRYLCVDRNNVTADGRVREDSDISIHSGSNFYVIGHIPNVEAINPDHLFIKKKIIVDTKHSNLKEIVLICVVGFIVSLIILATLTPVVARVRSGLENLFINKAQTLKEQLKDDLKREIGKNINNF